MLHNYHYAYFVGAIIFWIAWAGCLVAGTSYRREMRWGTLLAFPTALTSPLFVPQYWNPESLFNLDHRIRVGIEDFLWAAAVGGIAAIIGELVLKDHLAALRQTRHTRHYWPFLVIAAIVTGLQIWHPQSSMINVVIGGAAGALLFAWLRPDLIRLMLMSTAAFCLLYFFLYLAVLFLYPEFVSRFYNVPKLLGIYIAGIPIEEFLFAAAFGSLWSVGYEYVHGYHLESIGAI